MSEGSECSEQKGAYPAATQFPVPYSRLSCNLNWDEEMLQ